MKTETERAGIHKAMPAMAVSIITGIIVSLMLLFAAAMLISGGAMDIKLSGAASALCCLLGSAVSGYMAERAIGHRAALTGIIAGAVFFLTLIAVGAAFFRRLWPENGILWIMSASVFGGIAGGILKGIKR